MPKPSSNIDILVKGFIHSPDTVLYLEHANARVLSRAERQLGKRAIIPPGFPRCMSPAPLEECKYTYLTK
jgi:hypothetical protein